MTTPPQDQPLSILKGTNATDLIQRLGQEDLIQNGRLHVLGLDVIRDRNPRRWPLRQEGVWDYLTREFHKSFLESDHLVRLNDVNFLLIQPTQSAIAAQSKSLTLLKVALKFFLGEAANADIKLNVVTGLSGEGLTCELAVVSESALAHPDEPTLIEPQSSAPVAKEEVGAYDHLGVGVDDHDGSSTLQAGMVAYQSNRASRSSPRLLNGDRQYEVLFGSEPIWSIKQQAIVSYILRPLIFERRSDGYIPVDMTAVSTRDLIRLDLLILAEGKRLLQTEGRAAGFVLNVPISQSTLSSNTGRQAVQFALDDMRPYAASTLVACITGLAAGAPNSKIVELVSMLKSRCRAIVARAPSLAADIAHWRGAHLSAVSVDIHPLVTAEIPTAAHLSQFAKRTEGVAPAMILYAAPNSAVTLTAWSTGFTHVGGEMLLRGLHQPFTAVRFQPKDLYPHQRKLSA